MAKIKIEKEELERDEFMESTDRALLWLKDNGRTLALVLAVVVAGYAIFGLISSQRYNTLAEANDSLAEVLASYQSALNEHTWASPERVSAMEEVARRADEIAARYPDTSIANQARFLKGSAYFNAGDSIEEAREGGARNTANAIETFAQFVAQADRPFEQAKGRLALGYAYENAFFLNNDTAALGDAIRVFNEAHADASAPEFLRAEALLAEARLLAFTRRTDAAIERYREVMEMRYEPLPPLEEGAGPGLELIRTLDMTRDQFSLVGTARLELQRLGVDVETEYPIVAREEG